MTPVLADRTSTSLVGADLHSQLQGLQFAKAPQIDGRRWTHVGIDRDGKQTRLKHPLRYTAHLLFPALTAFARLCRALPLVCSG